MEMPQRRSFRETLSDFAADESSSGRPPSMEEIATGLRTLLAASVVSLATPTDAAAAEPRALKVQEQRQEFFSKSDLEFLAKNVFHEARGESAHGQLAIAQVTFARLASKRWGHSIQDVVYAKRQFSWTAYDPQELARREGGDLVKLTEIFVKHFAHKSPEAIVRELSQITGLPENTQFYKSTDAQMSERSKAFFDSLIKVGQIGKHEFYISAPRPPLMVPQQKKPPHTKKTIRTATKN